MGQTLDEVFSNLLSTGLPDGEGTEWERFIDNVSNSNNPKVIALVVDVLSKYLGTDNASAVLEQLAMEPYGFSSNSFFSIRQNEHGVFEMIGRLPEGFKLIFNNNEVHKD